MFNRIALLVSKFTFWFIFVCALCLVFSTIGIMIFGWLPPGWVLILDTIALLWCLFAGTIPVIYSGIMALAAKFDDDNDQN